jgi:hypothetical protein
MMETIVDIYQLFGQNTNKAYEKTHSSVKVWIVPASNETVALYDNMGQGQLFSLRIISDDIGSLKPQTKLQVVDSQISGFDNKNLFITIGDTKQQRIMGRFYLTGVCYKSENAS